MDDLYAQLTSALQGCRVGSRLLCPDSVDSTNTEAKRHAAQGADEGLVILSRHQSAGRGRAGRTFHSPDGLGLYLSALLHPCLSPETAASFTAWTAVAVCDAIQAACGLRPQIKWTNDLVMNGKKLCGILTELAPDPKTGRPDYLVVGIGINVDHTPADFPDEIRSIATSLSMELGRKANYAQLATQVMLALDRLYARFPAGKSDYLERYRADCLTTGKPVRLITPTTTRDAFATGIDDEFRLLVKFPDGSTQAVSTGEVSVRGMYGYV